MLDDSMTQQDTVQIQRVELQQWLIGKIAGAAGAKPQAIDMDAPIASYGLDSSAMLELACDLEDWLEREVDHAVLYDYPTIRRLAEYLGEEN